MAKKQLTAEEYNAKLMNDKKCKWPLDKKYLDILKQYPLDQAQDGVAFATNFSKHNAQLMIPFNFKCTEKLDFDLMRKAIAIEIERNDALCDRFYKDEKGNFSQYFVEPADVHYEVSEVDYSSLTDEQQKKAIMKEANIDLQIFNGQFGRFVLYHANDGTDGILFFFNHFNVDGFGATVTIHDLFGVYMALRDGTEMPKPLASWRKVLEKQIISEEEAQKNADFYASELKKIDPFYRSDRFDARRSTNKKLLAIGKKKKLPSDMYGLLSLFHLKAGQDIFNIPADKVKEIGEFAQANGIPVPVIFYTAIRLYMAKLHNMREYEMFNVYSNRRATKSEKNCGGSMQGVTYIVTKITPEMSERECFAEVQDRLVTMYRYNNISGKTATQLTDPLDWGEFTYYGSFDISFFSIPTELLEAVKGDFFYIYNGQLTCNDYCMLIPRRDGSLDFYFNYRTWHYDSEQSALSFGGIMEAINAMLSLGLDGTAAQIVDKIS